MEKTMKQKIEKGKRMFTHKIDSSRLKPGDHIYTYRGIRSYSHHGIYVGEGCVIHFTPTETSGGGSDEQPPCATCRYQRNVHLGVVKSCIDCFLSHGSFASESLRLYQYEESRSGKKWKRAGTCSTSKCLPPETVVKNATDKLQGGNCFGQYNLVDNNCEHFATYCKTGTRKSEQVLSTINKPLVRNLINSVKNVKLSS